MYYGDNDYRDYLAHYGVVGMHWGIRRYQPYSYTRNRDYGKSGKEIGVAKKLSKASKTAAKVGVEVAKTVSKGAQIAYTKGKEIYKDQKSKQLERRRQDLIQNGTVKQIRANRGRVLTEEDVKTAINRMKNDQSLKDLEESESRRSIERGKKYIKDVVDLGVSVSSIVNSAVSLRNAYETESKRPEEKAKEEAKKSRAINAENLIRNVKNEKDFDKIVSDHWSELDEDNRKNLAAARQQYDNARGINKSNKAK